MNRAFSTHKLDKVLGDRRKKLEAERQQILNKTKQWLDNNAPKYGINQAYIFGSLISPGKFHQDSDVDLAVEQINAEDYFSVISLLSTYLEREVDILLLKQCHFAHRICQQGILWTKTL